MMHKRITLFELIERRIRFRIGSLLMDAAGSVRALNIFGKYSHILSFILVGYAVSVVHPHSGGLGDSDEK